MKPVFIAAITLLLTGCSEKVWWLEYKPMNDAERKLCAEHAARILAHTPTTLQGNDQDWDHAITAAHKEAKKLFCEPTMWEVEVPSRTYTGRWRYLTNTIEQTK